MHVVLRDAFGTALAEGDLTIGDVAHEDGTSPLDQLRRFGSMAKFPLQGSTSNPALLFDLLVSFHG
jgi:hypothetical protein